MITPKMSKSALVAKKNPVAGKILNPPRLVTDTQSDSSQFLRALVLGASKSGKTHFIGTFPKSLIINCGKTLATLAAEGKKIPTITIVPETDRSLEGELNSWLHVREVILDLLQEGGRFWDQLPYKPESLIIDHLNGLCSIMENEIVRHPPSFKPGEEAKKRTVPQLERSDYNIIQRRLYIDILMIAFDLRMHFACVSELRQTEDDSGRTRMIPALTGTALGMTVPGQFNEVLYTYAEREEGKKAKARYYLTAIPERQIPYLGTRALPIMEPVEDPSFDKIVGKKKS
jgi:hypothetical protein